MTAPIRAVTAGELTKLRSDGQWSKLRLVVIPQPAIMQCRVNQTFSSYDEITSITYDTVTYGAYTDVVAGMTLWVGSSAGACDLGMARVKSITSSVITIGRVSDIVWADNLYLTIVDDFNLWGKQPTLLTDGVYIDDDIVYSDQHLYMNPVPIMGPDTAIKQGESGATYQPDASNSYCPGSSISGYSWSATGAASSSGTTTATPTFTFTANGLHRITLTITAANGKTTTGHRVVWVYDDNSMPNDQITVESLTGEASQDCWSTTITVYDDATTTDIRDRAKIMLVAEDYYGGTLGSIGQVSGSEHVVFVGMIDGESIQYNRDLSTVMFSAYGLAWFADRLGSASTLIEDVSGTPANWTQMAAMTIDRIVWHWFYWRATIIETCDLYPSGDAIEVGGATAAMGSVWGQVKEIVETRRMAFVRCDRLGRIHVFVDPQVLPVASRSSIVVVQAITGDDLSGDVKIDRRVTSPVSMLNLSGLVTSAGVTTSVMSRASGRAYKHFGRPETKDRLVLSSQTQANEMAGMIIAKMNNEFPLVTLELAENNRMIDIAPAQYVTMTITADQNARGITWTAKKVIPTRVEISINPETGFISTSIEGEAETSGTLGVTVAIPQEAVYNFPSLPSLPGINTEEYSFPIAPTQPFIVPPTYIPPSLPGSMSQDCPTGADANGPYDLWLRGTYYPGSPAQTQFKCILRSSAHSNVTRYELRGSFYKRNTPSGNWSLTTDDNFYNIIAYDADGNFTIGIHDTVGSNPFVRTGYFAPSSNMEIKYISLGINNTWSFSPETCIAHFSATNAVVVDDGDYVWWKDGNKVGFHWWNNVIRGRFSQNFIKGVFLPPTGETYADKWFHVKGYVIYTPITAATLQDYDWQCRNHTDIKWKEIIAGLAVDNDFQNINDSIPVGLTHYSWEAHTYFGIDYDWSTEMFFEIWPMHEYRIVIDKVYLYNICKIPDL